MQCCHNSPGGSVTFLAVIYLTLKYDYSESFYIHLVKTERQPARHWWVGAWEAAKVVGKIVSESDRSHAETLTIYY